MRSGWDGFLVSNDVATLIKNTILKKFKCFFSCIQMENEMHYLQIQIAELGIQFIQLIEYLRKRRKKFRRWWSKPLIRNNYLTGYGDYARVFNYFKLHDEEQFINFTRMNVQVFMYIYNLIRERLVKRSQRPPLPPELRFSLTLK